MRGRAKRFAAASPGEPARIIFHVEPEKAGIRACRIGLIDGPELALDQFVYP